MKKKQEELDVNGINDVVSVSKKILKLFYIVLIVSTLFLGTLLIKEVEILGFIGNILKVISPLFIGFIIAWILEPLVVRLNKKGMKRGFSAAIVFVGFVASILVFLGFLFPVIYQQLLELIESLPGVFTWIKDSFNDMFNTLGSIEGLDVATLKDTIFTNINGVFTSVTENLPEMLYGFGKSLFSGIGVFILGLVVAIYMMVDFEDNYKQLTKFIPKKYRKSSVELLGNISTEVRKTVNGTLTVASIVFAVSSIGFGVVGLQAPLLFGVFCGITNLIPYVGPYIGGAAAVIVAFSQNIMLGLIVLVICVIIQLLENNILQPMVMSKSMHLHPVVIMIGLLVFGSLFGIVGMILATPTMSLIKTVIQFFNDKYNLIEE